MSTDTAEHMTDISTHDDNTNNEIPAGCASLQIQAIANSLVPKILQGVNERLPDLVINISSQKGFVSTAGYDDESDEEESGTQLPNKSVIGTQVPDKQLNTWMDMPKILGRRI